MIMRGALSPGIRLANHYQIEKVIGGGGFGITYVGLDVRTMSQVCIKELFIHKQSVRHEDRTDEQSKTIELRP